MKTKYLDFYKTNFGTAKYCTKSWGLASFKAGAQSRQAEIDELQKRIEEALKHVVDHGGYDDLTHVINILKKD